jgi:hypothetical protein
MIAVLRAHLNADMAPADGDRASGSHHGVSGG